MDFFFLFFLFMSVCISLDVKCAFGFSSQKEERSLLKSTFRLQDSKVNATTLLRHAELIVSLDRETYSFSNHTHSLSICHISSVTENKDSATALNSKMKACSVSNNESIFLIQFPADGQVKVLEAAVLHPQKQRPCHNNRNYNF